MHVRVCSLGRSLGPTNRVIVAIVCVLARAHARSPVLARATCCEGGHILVSECVSVSVSDSASLFVSHSISVFVSVSLYVCLCLGALLSCSPLSPCAYVWVCMLCTGQLAASKDFTAVPSITSDNVYIKSESRSHSHLQYSTNFNCTHTQLQMESRAPAQRKHLHSYTWRLK